MIVSITNPVQATIIFCVVFILGILISARRRKDQEILSLEVTQELKGIAILMVVFSHIGYFLVNDHTFLYPLTIAAGVGVNLFLFLSGYGLTVSSSRSKDTILQSYYRRLGKLFVPMWLVIGVFALLDHFFLGRSYSPIYLLQAIIGYFPHADLYQDINSPLWYFTLILFYYLLFPILFFKKRPWLSALILFIISFLIVKSEPTFLNQVLHLHKIHLLAFPLGMITAFLFAKIPVINFWQKIQDSKYRFFRWLIIIASASLAIYTIINSNIGMKGLEEITSIITVLSLVLMFMFKRISLKAFYWIGFFSYEIYLLHWPIMYRYDFLYRLLPSWLATTLYIVVLIGLGWVWQFVTNWITRKHLKKVA